MHFTTVWCQCIPKSLSQCRKLTTFNKHNFIGFAYLDANMDEIFVQIISDHFFFYDQFVVWAMLNRMSIMCARIYRTSVKKSSQYYSHCRLCTVLIVRCDRLIDAVLGYCRFCYMCINGKVTKLQLIFLDHFSTFFAF